MVIKKEATVTNKTINILNQCEDIEAAMFSILEPGKYIPEHKGPFTGCLRYHLGLQIPNDNSNCYIIVNDIKYYWNEGESLIFDDTYKHSVYNNTNEPRIILFIDIRRPLDTKITKLLTNILINNKSMINFINEINQKSELVKELFHN